MSQDIPRGAPNVPKPVPAGTLTNGMLVFFGTCKKSAHRKAMKFSFKGHAFGIMLGVVPLFGKEPDRKAVVARLAGVGFVLLDDVADFLGDEAVATFTDKFHEKYDEKQPTEPEIETPPSMLVGADGEPLAPPEREAIPLAAVPEADA